MEINYTFYFFAFLRKMIKKLLTFCYWSSQTTLWILLSSNPLEWLHTPIYQASLMRSEQALREAAGLEQGEAQQDRVAHAGPYRA